MEERFLEEMIKSKKLIFAPTQEDILSKIPLIEERLGFKWAGLYCAGYLTAGRISELLPLENTDLTYSMKNRQHFANISLLTLKNRKLRLRNITIPLQTETEKALFEPFKKAMEHTIKGKVFAECATRNNIATRFSNSISFNLKVLDFATKKTEIKEIRLHPHLLRHFRLTHMVTLYNFPAINLQFYAGWSSLEPAQTYLAISAEEQMEIFSRNQNINTMETITIHDGKNET